MTLAAVNRLLFISILVMTVVPMTSAMYFLNRALDTSLNLGFNAEILETLNDASLNLRTLGRLDPQQSQSYREQFQRIEDLREVYGSQELIRQGIHRSLIIYFCLGVAAALVTSLAAATLLARRISRSFHHSFEELSSQRERIRYLEHISSWQEFAKILAHEIKNPLTPIEMLVSDLTKAYRLQTPDKFHDQLTRTQTMVMEEVGHLKSIVERFSSFAKLPQMELEASDVREVVCQHFDAMRETFNSARISVHHSDEALYSKIDRTLLRQALTNIVRNGAEANPGHRVTFTVTITSAPEDHVAIVISNDGTRVPESIADRIFDPYISSKTGSDNMGLGLAIVRKILIEHGGDVSYSERGGHPTFTLTLPRIAYGRTG